MQDNSIIDLHSHLLPHLDDGSDSIEMSLAILRREAGQGVGTVCVMPRFYLYQNNIETFCERRGTALEKLMSAALDGLFQIVPAAEAAFFQGSVNTLPWNGFVSGKTGCFWWR